MNMNKRKAAYFDSQIDAPWANAEYGPEELEGLFFFCETGINEK